MSMTPKQQEQLRQLPSITSLLDDEAVQTWLKQHPRSLVVAALNCAIDEARSSVIESDIAPDPAAIVRAAELALEKQTAPSIRRVINATGVVLHTGLGRAPLSDAAIRAVTECASGYCNLEFDLESGARGRRVDHVAALLAELTGAEAATVVNNNAAATLMILNTVASGKGVIVSRGELVEIGGSYRLPDMMRASSARLCEVGTTNRTRIADYEKAVEEDTAALMRVHTSNYRVVGFTQAVGIDELVQLGRKHNLPVIDDLGSGALFDLSTVGMGEEPSVRASIDAGADLVCFSGDKILGGPQAGIIVGSKDWIQRIERNPLMRTYRVGKMTLAALEATLQCYRDEQQATETTPSLAMMSASLESLKNKAETLHQSLIEKLPNEDFQVTKATSAVGGGSYPGRELETYCVTWQPKTMTIDEALKQLRTGNPAVVARAQRERILYDVRTIIDADLIPLIDRIAELRTDP